MKRKTKRKTLTEMTTAELARATAEFDEEFVSDTFKPLTGEGRAEWARIKRKRGRPTVGKGAKVVSVSIERRLLERADRLAKQKGISRARLIVRGLRAVLAAEGMDGAEPA